MEGGQFAHLSFDSKKKLSLGIHRTTQLPVTEFNRCIYCGAFINYMHIIFEKKARKSAYYQYKNSKITRHWPVFRLVSIFLVLSRMKPITIKKWPNISYTAHCLTDYCLYWSHFFMPLLLINERTIKNKSSRPHTLVLQNKGI